MSESYLLPLRDTAGDPITGKVKAGFALRYYVDGVSTATTAVTITEVGTSGDYRVGVPDPTDNTDHVLVIEDGGALGVPDGWLVTVEWPARIRNAELVAAVWAASTRTLTSFGALVADVTAAVAAAVWSFATRTLTSFSGTAVYSGPVEPTGDVTIVRGDDYAAADGRSLTWTDATWPSLTGATITMTARDLADAVLFTKTGAVVSASSIRVELTPTQTTIPVGSHRFDVQAARGPAGRIVTLQLGTLGGAAEMTRAS